MIANKLDIEELKEVGGGWVDTEDHKTYYVLDDKTLECLAGPFYSSAEAQKRATELGQDWHGMSPAIKEYLLKKNNKN